MAGKPELGLLLMGKPKGKPMGEEPEPADEMADERRTAARGLIKAIKAGDEDLVADAFEQMLACCDDMMGGDGDEGEEE